MRSLLIAFTLVVTALVAQAGTRDLFVVSVLDNQVYRYDGLNGSLLGQLSGGPLNSPLGIAFGPDGDLYVASDGNDLVLRYDGDTGQYRDEAGQFQPNSGLSGLAFGPNGNIYGTLLTFGRVDEIEGASGVYQAPFTSGYTLSSPYKLTFTPSGDLLVNDSGNNQVVRFNGANGGFLGVFSKAANLASPRALTYGPDGNLYVAGYATANVDKFDGQVGTFLADFVEDPNVNRPAGIAFGTSGDLFLSSTNTSQVFRYDGKTGASKGVFVNSVRFPNDIAFNPTVARPAAFAVERGILKSGNLTSLSKRDGDRMQIDKGLVLNLGEAPVTLRMEGKSSFANPSLLQFCATVRTSTPVLVETVELFDFQAGAYVAVDSRKASLLDTFAVGRVASPQRFVEPGTLRVLARLRVFAPGPTPTFSWSVQVDQGCWTFAP